MIEDLQARKIFDSRGYLTIEIEVFTDSGWGMCSAPSGASVGKHEAMAFPETVDKSIEMFEGVVKPELLGMDPSEQRRIDELLRKLDGTSNFSKIGGNLAVAISIAVAKASASEMGASFYRYLNPLAKRVPTPIGNVLGGGKHCIGGPAIQEFLSIPVGKDSLRAVHTNVLVHQEIAKQLRKKLPNTSIGKGDEGAWVGMLDDEAALQLVAQCCAKVGVEQKMLVELGLDVAASALYDGKKYKYRKKELSREEQIDFMVKLVEKYGVAYLEDPMDEEDFEGFALLTEQVGKHCMVVGDDLFVTSRERLEKGVKKGACNSILIKPNQVGTLTGTAEAIELARRNNYHTVISHRSGETTDTSIAHLGTAFGCEFIKTGVVGGERTAKLNELIRIEEEIRC